VTAKAEAHPGKPGRRVFEDVHALARPAVVCARCGHWGSLTLADGEFVCRERCP
jgi:hypothetical protein